ncbi:MAG: hypothetical protein IPK76_25585 [Lewinellaceae bacterium]|nr:hypothetical protein [Lewinellaceae bacterium]
MAGHRAGILTSIMPPDEAAETAYRLLLECEGAVTMYKLTGSEQHLERSSHGAVGLFGTSHIKKNDRKRQIKLTPDAQTV